MRNLTVGARAAVAKAVPAGVDQKGIASRTVNFLKFVETRREVPAFTKGRDRSATARDVVPTIALPCEKTTNRKAI